MDAIIICVPTPLNEYHEPDLSFITDTTHSIAPHLRAGQLVVLESTTYPGTTEDVMIPILEKENKAGLKAARNGASHGERILCRVLPRTRRSRQHHCRAARHSEGRRRIEPAGLRTGPRPLRLHLQSHRSRLVARRRGNDQAAGKHLPLRQHRAGQRTQAVVPAHGHRYLGGHRAASTKPFGFHPFYPGPGLGGHCIPIDPFYLSWKAKEFDFRTRFIELAGEINNNMPYHVLSSVSHALNRHKKAVNGARVLVLGVAYKKDIDDLRESPALTIIELLQKDGAQVSYHDPYFPFIGKGRKYDLQMKCAELKDLGQYDCVVIVTDHSDYDYRRIVQEAQLVVDTSNATKGIDSPRIVRC